MPGFPHYYQLDAMDCGPACLRMIAAFYGKSYSLQSLRRRSSVTREGVSLLGISDAANDIGLRNAGARVTYKKVLEDAVFPCIVHWNQNHFVVVYKMNRHKVWVADPALGKMVYTREEFLKGWISTRSGESDMGLVLLLEPAPDFYNRDDEETNENPFRLLVSCIRPYRKYFSQLLIGVLLGSLFLLIFPFLTQAIVDIGINNNDPGFVTMVLIAQLVLFISISSVEVIRGWILLHISTRVNISLISGFLLKMMNLPLGFFHSKQIGDLLQRIGDHARIERFLTSSLLNIIFSTVNLITFGIVLVIYSWKLFFVFLIGTILYLLWVQLFMGIRRKLDYQQFEQQSRNQGKLIEMISGIGDIKLNNSETSKRWEWESIQARLFRVNIKSLTVGQLQGKGAEFILRLVSILSTFLAARYVMEGQITLGAMLAITYVIGQMNGPIEQILTFFQSSQEAVISLERLGEIHSETEKEEDRLNQLDLLPSDHTITIKDLSFQYEGPRSPFVLKGINLTIPAGETTAIVGVSGSGKTTLMKLILGFFDPAEGEIRIGPAKLSNLRESVWRSHCGVVLQDGFLFSDSIARNIALGEETIDKERLYHSAGMACIKPFIESLPLGYNTVIGQNGIGLSQGQKQRILIARALYKQPRFLFFDEATNALDAVNERKVIENINEFSRGRTVIVIAHRLSTVKNAGQIVVLDKGEVVEQGKHNELIKKKGVYYHLVKEQLELGG